MSYVDPRLHGLLAGTYWEQLISELQVRAVSFFLPVTQAKCWSVIPLNVGIVLISLLLLARGMVALSELYFDFFHILFTRPFVGNPFISIARVLVLALGVGDICAAFGGLFAVTMPNFVAALGFVCWFIVQTIPKVFVVVVMAAFDTPGLIDLGSSLTFLIAAVAVFLDITFALAAVHLLLKTTLQLTVSRRALRVLADAQHVAAQQGAVAVGERHLLHALLEHSSCQHMLEVSGVSIHKLQHTGSAIFFHSSQYAPQQDFDEDDRYEGSLPLRQDTEDAVAAAIALQRRAEEQLLKPEHFVLALCITGQLAFDHDSHTGATSYPVNTMAMRQFLEAERKRIQEEEFAGLPGALFFGVFPHEETVMVLTTLRLIVAFASLFSFIWYGTGLETYIGIHVDHHDAQDLQFFLSVGALFFTCIAMVGISRFRGTRWKIREAAYDQGGRWDASVFHQFEMIRQTHPDAEEWCVRLHVSAKALEVFLMWSFIEFLVSIPTVCILLVNGNVCNSYNHGLVRVARDGMPLASEVAMHCNSNSQFVLGCVVFLFVFHLVAFWCSLILWHQYAHGWTLISPHGQTFLTLPGSGLMESLAWKLTGLSEVNKRRLMDERETAPLLRGQKFVTL